MRAVLRLGMLVIFAVIIVPIAAVVKIILPWYWWVLPPFVHRIVCRILGITITCKGQRLKGQPVLFVSNHISWKDIIILGAVIKKASFVSKAEVGSIGFVKKIVDLQKTIYVKRERRTDALKQSSEMTTRIQDGDSLILFPEGTTTRGIHVGPFKSTLFSVAEMILKGGQPSVTIQPITINFTHIDKLPIQMCERVKVGWIGEESFWPHFMYALRRKSTHVSVEFHRPLRCKDQIDRKILAKTCEDIIRQGLSASHRQLLL